MGKMSKREEIRKDLLDQLDRNGTCGKQYEDLVEVYMQLWDTVRDLTAEIDEKGVMIKYQNGENQFGWRKNDSVSERNRTINQMLKVLSQLDLKPSPKDDNIPDEM